MHFRRSRRAGEISFAARIAPSLHVPCGFQCHASTGEFRVLTIRDRLPARSQRFLERRLQQIFVDRFHRDAIDARSQSFFGHEMVGGVRASTEIV